MKRKNPIKKYLCMVCWDRIPWHKGQADQVDEVVAMHCSRLVSPEFASDAGVCDDCWTGLAGPDAELRAEAA